jgi:hypothetical protein
MGRRRRMGRGNADGSTDGGTEVSADGSALSDGADEDLDPQADGGAAGDDTSDDSEVAEFFDPSVFAAARQRPDRPNGPWDDAEADAAAEVARVDFGSLRVPVAENLRLRVDTGPDQRILGVTVEHEQSAVQINAFAAPRSAGIWDEIREEIAESLRASGGSADDHDGPFGIELRAKVPTDTGGRSRGLTAARFVGVDGPRWFLRGLITGPAATDERFTAEVEAAFRDVIVVRGQEAMAPRDPLPLTMPKELDDAGEGTAAGKRPGLERLRRGPEITETR